MYKKQFGKQKAVIYKSLIRQLMLKRLCSVLALCAMQNYNVVIDAYKYSFCCFTLFPQLNNYKLSTIKRNKQEVFVKPLMKILEFLEYLYWPQV